MKVESTGLPGVLVIEPVVHRDHRGFFLETWRAERYAEAGLPTRFVQDNHSRSARGTLRELHYQVQQVQGKLVRCAAGEISAFMVRDAGTALRTMRRESCLAALTFARATASRSRQSRCIARSQSASQSLRP